MKSKPGRYVQKVGRVLYQRPRSTVLEEMNRHCLGFKFEVGPKACLDAIENTAGVG